MFEVFANVDALTALTRIAPEVGLALCIKTFVEEGEVSLAAFRRLYIDTWFGRTPAVEAEVIGLSAPAPVTQRAA